MRVPGMKQKERTFFDERVEVGQRREDGNVGNGVTVGHDFINLGLKLCHNVGATSKLPEPIRDGGGG